MNHNYIFLGNIDYLKRIHIFPYMKGSLFGLMPNAYGIFKLSLQFGEIKIEILKKL